MAGPTQPLRCVRCGEPLLPSYMTSCPRCGLPVRVSVEEQAQGQGQASGGWDAGGAPGQESHGYGEPQGFGSGTYGRPAAPSYPLYGQPAGPSVPFYGQPAGPSVPLYGQAAPPSVPFYGQPAGPSMPMPGYGQPAGPSVPLQGYGQPAGPSVPYYGQPAYGGMPPMGGEQPGRRTGLIVALVVVLVLVIGGASAAIVVLSHGGQQSATTGGGTSATATATATGTATPGSGSGSVLYQSKLTGSVFGWPSRSGCTPNADGYHVQADVSCFAPTQDLADFDLKVTAQQVSGDSSNPYGVTFRGSATAGGQISSVYAFMADDQGDYAFFKVSGGNSTMIQRGQTQAMHQGGANTFEVRAKGSHFTLLVNGTQVTQADDASISSGKVGLQGYSGSDIRFTNLTITSL